MGRSVNSIMREKQDHFIPMVYICAPFGGNVSLNTERAIQLGKLAYERGCLPVIPHVQFPFMDDANPDDRKNALWFDIILMGKCQEVWVLGDTITFGMEKELRIATKRRQTIRWFDKDYKEVK